MKASIDHLTIVSESPDALGRFYEGLFHMRPAGAKGVAGDVSIGDGRIGLTIKPRLAGDRAQLDRFGIEVDDIDLALARIAEKFPAIAVADNAGGDGRGPSFSTHDPAGNVFRLCRTGAADDEFYEPDGQARRRFVDHFALRVLHPRRVADFYVEVFDFLPLERPGSDRNVYLSDGRVTLAIIPWTLSDFEQTGISARGMDHIGFKVESVAALKADVARAAAENFRFQPNASVVGRGKEGAGRLAMFRRTCPLGCHHMADPDGLLIDIVE